jgi:hypothetical protein
VLIVGVASSHDCTLRLQIESRLLNSLIFIKIDVKSRMLRGSSDKIWALETRFKYYITKRIITVCHKLLCGLHLYRNMPECPLACQGDEWQILNSPPSVGGVRGGGGMSMSSPPPRSSPVKGEEKQGCPAACRGELHLLKSDAKSRVQRSALCAQPSALKTLYLVSRTLSQLPHALSPKSAF